GQSADSARRICAACPVQPECRTYALDHPSLCGIWGGSSEMQRKRLRAKTRRAATPRKSTTANP
ncbi:WhiB family transcriptional regulator, partial [Glycomyces tenuis]